jgi:type I restriction enzyme S subunit
MKIKLKEVTGKTGIVVDGDWVESKDQDINGDVRLIQLADIGEGKFLDRSARFLTKETAKNLNCTYLRKGDILIARMPDPIGRACIFPNIIQPCVTVVDVCVVRVDPDFVDNRWLMWILNSPHFRFQLTPFLSGTTRQRISRKNLESLEIPLPPIASQRRIADILDKADEIIRKRKEAIALTEQLQKSIFLDMFYRKNLEDCQITTLEKIISKKKNSIRTGPFGSQLLHSEFVDQGIAVLGIDNAVNNYFTWGKPRFITEEKYEQLKRYTVNSRDIIITIMGTCGKCAIIPENIPIAINTKHLCCISLNEEKCLPEFLHSYFLIHPHSKRYLSKYTKGAIMDGLNMTIIKQMPIPLFSINLQKKYKNIFDQTNSTLEKYKTNLQESENLFYSLLQKAFKGEL